MSMPLPLSPTLSQPDVYTAVYNLLTQYITPTMPSTNIFRGYTNRMALPAGSNEYAVLQIIGQYRRGTNVSTFSALGATRTEDGDIMTDELVECDMQVDFYSKDDSARSRAQVLESLARDGVVSQYLKQSLVACLYASDVRDLSLVVDADQYVRRYQVTLRLAFWMRVSLKLPWFDNVTIDKVVDITDHRDYN